MHGKTAETNPGSRVPSLSRTWSPIMNQVDFRLFLLLISDLNVYINVQTLKVRHFSIYIEFYISGRQAQLSSFQRSGNIQGVQATGFNLECMVLRLGFVGLSRETYLELFPPPIHRRAMFQKNRLYQEVLLYHYFLVSCFFFRLRLPETYFHAFLSSIRSTKSRTRGHIPAQAVIEHLRFKSLPAKSVTGNLKP